MISGTCREPRWKATSTPHNVVAGALACRRRERSASPPRSQKECSSWGLHSFFAEAVMFVRSILPAAIAVCALCGSAAFAQSADTMLAQILPSTPSSTAPAGVTSGSTTRTPSATTMPYQNSTTPSYSSWPPTVQTPSPPAYRSTQPTYQTNSALAPAATTSTSTQTNNPACAPGSPITPSAAGSATTLAGATAGANGCP